MRGIDVSCHNGKINWQEIKASGIDFAICRSSFGKSSADETFQRNVEEAHAAGLICGAYHYSYALNPQEAMTEGEFCKKIISNSGVLLELPVFFDMEDADNYKARNGFNFSRWNITAICENFLDEIKPLNCGIYASYSWLEKYIDWKKLNCPVWNAQWGKRDFLQGYIWQFTDALNIGGKYFDGNILYDNKDRAENF